MSQANRPYSLVRRAARAALLSAAAMAIALPAILPAKAQSALRGEISEEEGNADLLLKRKKGAPASPRSQTDYEPASTGALTAAEERDQLDAGATIADQTQAQAPVDPFADSAPIPSPRPAAKKTAASNKKRPLTAAERKAAKALATDDLATGTVRQPSIDAGAREAGLLDPGAEREAAIEAHNRKLDDKPFDPVGMRVGTFILRPSFEQGLTYNDNASASAQGSEAVQTESTLRLNAVSDWSQHKATLDAYGIFRKSLSGEDLQQAEGGISGTLDLDLSREYKLKTSLGYAAKPESASSPVMLGNVVEQPLRQAFNGSVGVSKELGKLEFGVSARAERSIYGEADLQGGGTLNQDERNATLGTIALRGGYEISPAITPFAEIEIGRRQHDEEFDSAGFERSSDRLAARAGVAVDIEEKLTGEFSAGWLRESFDDQRLDAISGLSLEADLRWSPMRDTSVGLRLSTTVEGTTAANESGSLLHSGRLSLERQIRSNLTANATLGADWRDYSSGGHDLLLSGELSATWWLNRYAGLTGRLKHEQQTSDLPGREYKSNSVFLGVKVQR